MKIEKDIPVAKGGRGFGVTVYPFGAMEVGDSFKIDGDAVRNARNSSYNYGFRHKKKFSTRKIGAGEYRIWRIR